MKTTVAALLAAAAIFATGAAVAADRTALVEYFTQTG